MNSKPPVAAASGWPHAPSLSLASRRRTPLPGAADATGERPRKEAGDLRVLVVDDDADMRGSLEDYLGLEDGVEVVSAGDMATATRAAREAPPDVALLDIRLGAENGVDLIPMLRGVNPGIFCIVMTAYRDPDFHERAMRSGANEFLYKPLDPDRLARLIRRGGA